MKDSPDDNIISFAHKDKIEKANNLETSRPIQFYIMGIGEMVRSLYFLHNDYVFEDEIPDMDTENFGSLIATTMIEKMLLYQAYSVCDTTQLHRTIYYRLENNCEGIESCPNYPPFEDLGNTLITNTIFHHEDPMVCALSMMMVLYQWVAMDELTKLPNLPALFNDYEEESGKSNPEEEEEKPNE